MCRLSCCAELDNCRLLLTPQGPGQYTTEHTNQSQRNQPSLQPSQHLHPNPPKSPPTPLPQLRIPLPILHPPIPTLTHFPHRQNKLPLRLARRFRTRGRVQRSQRAFEGCYGGREFHRKLEEGAEEGGVFALQVGLDEARVEGVGC
jgi:hypothetical protein